MRYLSKAGVVVVGLAAFSAGAQVELKNDGFTPGGNVGFQSGFVAGEAAAVKLTSPAPNAQLTAVRLLFGGASSNQTITLTIYDDAAGTTPGAVLFTGDYALTGSDTAMQELDLSADNVMVGSAFRVGIGFQHAGTPSVARDDDGLTANVNFLNLQGMGWVGATTVGLAGDWIIRAVVVPSIDAGTDAGLLDSGVQDSGIPDAGVPDAGLADAGGPQDSGVPDAGETPDAGVDAGSGTDAGTSTGMCTANTDCMVGNYCDLAARRCTFDCRAATDCGSNMTCSSLGKCVGDTKPAGCGCTSLEWVAASLALLLAARKRARH